MAPGGNGGRAAGSGRGENFGLGSERSDSVYPGVAGIINPSGHRRIFPFVGVG